MLELVRIAERRFLAEVAPDFTRRRYLRGVFKLPFEVDTLDEPWRD